MLYRNIKNGNVIDIPSVLSDPRWEMVKKPSPVSSSKTNEDKKPVTKSRKTKKKV